MCSSSAAMLVHLDVALLTAVNNAVLFTPKDGVRTLHDKRCNGVYESSITTSSACRLSQQQLRPPKLKAGTFSRRESLRIPVTPNVFLARHPRPFPKSVSSCSKPTKASLISPRQGFKFYTKPTYHNLHRHLHNSYYLS